MATRRTTRKTRRVAAPRRKAANRAVRQWSREEMAFMRKYYRKFETTWIARQLGRTVYSVRYKAVDLSLKKASPSIWRGNKGSANAFRSTTRRPVRKPVSRRATTRRNTTKRTYKAAPKRRQTKRAAKRPIRRRTRR